MGPDQGPVPSARAQTNASGPDSALQAGSATETNCHIGTQSSAVQFVSLPPPNNNNKRDVLIHPGRGGGIWQTHPLRPNHPPTQNQKSIPLEKNEISNRAKNKRWYVGLCHRVWAPSRGPPKSYGWPFGAPVAQCARSATIWAFGCTRNPYFVILGASFGVLLTPRVSGGGGGGRGAN